MKILTAISFILIFNTFSYAEEKFSACDRFLFLLGKGSKVEVINKAIETGKISQDYMTSLFRSLDFNSIKKIIGPKSKFNNSNLVYKSIADHRISSRKFKVILKEINPEEKLKVLNELVDQNMFHEVANFSNKVKIMNDLYPNLFIKTDQLSSMKKKVIKKLFTDLSIENFYGLVKNDFFSKLVRNDNFFVSGSDELLDLIYSLFLKYNYKDISIFNQIVSNHRDVIAKDISVEKFNKFAFILINDKSNNESIKSIFDVLLPKIKDLDENIESFFIHHVRSTTPNRNLISLFESMNEISKELFILNPLTIDQKKTSLVDLLLKYKHHDVAILKLEKELGVTLNSRILNNSRLEQFAQFYAFDAKFVGNFETAKLYDGIYNSLRTKNTYVKEYMNNRILNLVSAKNDEIDEFFLKVLSSGGVEQLDQVDSHGVSLFSYHLNISLKNNVKFKLDLYRDVKIDLSNDEKILKSLTKNKGRFSETEFEEIKKYIVKSGAS